MKVFERLRLVNAMQGVLRILKTPCVLCTRRRREKDLHCSRLCTASRKAFLTQLPVFKILPDP